MQKKIINIAILVKSLKLIGISWIYENLLIKKSFKGYELDISKCVTQLSLLGNTWQWSFYKEVIFVFVYSL